MFYPVVHFHNTYEEGVDFLFQGKFESAVESLEFSVKEGDVRSMELLAFLYSDTPFATFDEERMSFLMDMALKSNSFEAKLDRGIDLYIQDRHKESFDVFNNFQKDGSGISDFYLGVQYLSGQGVDRNIEKARMLFKKKIDQLGLQLSFK